ncbi:type VI secretion system-associated FHA domain protein TagH [Pseudoalteromonas carrageenovora]
MGLIYQMELILNITSYHRLSPEIEATKSVKTTLTFGRSESCDWHFPDPEKIISSKHGYFKKENDEFYIYDTSTNGVFVNFGVSALGQGNKQRLSNEDTITVGDFQIEVKLSQQAQLHSNTVEDPIDTIKNNTPRTEALEPSNENFFNSSIMDESMPDITMGQTSIHSSEEKIPENWDELAHLMNIEAAPKPPQPVIQQKEFLESKEVNKSKPVEKRSNESQINSQVAAEKSAPYNELPTPQSGSLTDAFLKGLGIKPQLQTELATAELWFEMGQGLNSLLCELMESLRQRALVKNQLRLNQTMFQTQQNNPLKFSANIDDVIQNLFIRNSASFLSSQESIQESFVDTRRHEHALLSGADGALKGLLEQMSPQHISQQVNDNANIFSIVPGQTESKCWKVYQNLYDELSQDINSKGALALSDDFLKAYNNKVQETS